MKFSFQIFDSDENELKLQLLTATRSNSIFTWPATEDVSWVPRTDVGRILSQPEIVAGRGMRMKFIDNEQELCRMCCLKSHYIDLKQYNMKTLCKYIVPVKNQCSGYWHCSSEIPIYWLLTLFSEIPMFLLLTLFEWNTNILVIDVV